MTIVSKESAHHMCQFHFASTSRIEVDGCHDFVMIIFNAFSF